MHGTIEALSRSAKTGTYHFSTPPRSADPRRVIRHWQAGAFRPARLHWGWMPPHPTLFLRRSLYERFGLFDTRYRIAADYDLMLRMLTTLAAGEVFGRQ